MHCVSLTIHFPPQSKQKVKLLNAQPLEVFLYDTDQLCCETGEELLYVPSTTPDNIQISQEKICWGKETIPIVCLGCDGLYRKLHKHDVTVHSSSTYDTFGD